MVSFHNAMPFGAVAAVHAWERVGSLLLVVIRQLLRIPISLDTSMTFSLSTGELGIWECHVWGDLLVWQARVHSTCDIMCGALGAALLGAERGRRQKGCVGT